MSDERWFERLAGLPDDASDRAPAKLKSKTYSAVVRRLAASGPLYDLSATKQAGDRLCVFENVLTWLPTALNTRSANPCRVCHARLLAERLDRAPIFWPGCPYSAFHRD